MCSFNLEDLNWWRFVGFRPEYSCLFVFALSLLRCNSCWCAIRLSNHVCFLSFFLFHYPRCALRYLWLSSTCRSPANTSRSIEGGCERLCFKYSHSFWSISSVQPACFLHSSAPSRPRPPAACASPSSHSPGSTGRLSSCWSDTNKQSEIEKWARVRLHQDQICC